MKRWSLGSEGRWEGLTWEGDVHRLTEVRQLGLPILAKYAILAAERSPSNLPAATTQVEDDPELVLGASSFSSFPPSTHSSFYPSLLPYPLPSLPPSILASIHPYCHPAICLTTRSPVSDVSSEASVLGTVVWASVQAL